MCRMIHVDQQCYEALMQAAAKRMSSILRSDISRRILERSRIKEEWGEVEALYSRQRVWRKVASTVARGMREHRSDFNKAVTEIVPASWTIRVDGRPAIKAEEEEKESEEDAVCMCCFDGSSLEGNRIMFCDGCNAAVHQACYGVQDIPEGDFFCDRCRAVQVLSDNREEDDEELDPERVRDVIKCCLCPLYHGGYKPTTDGRWVHLCCALWSGRATILDINEMSPIDISDVQVQEYMDLEPDSVHTASDLGSDSRPSEHPAVNVLTSRVHIDACIYCRALGGYVVRCGGSCNHGSADGLTPGNGDQCSAVFHPLCAWFQGVYLETKITDPTFQGQERKGLYPSGLSYCFLCDDHCPEDSKGPAREQQIAIRKKYRINIEDLEQIPGKFRLKRKKKKPIPVPRESSAHSRSALGSGPSKVKDLNRDVYDARICAVCLSPMEVAFPHSLYKPALRFTPQTLTLLGSTAVTDGTSDPQPVPVLLDDSKGSSDMHAEDVYSTFLPFGLCNPAYSTAYNGNTFLSQPPLHPSDAVSVSDSAYPEYSQPSGSPLRLESSSNTSTMDRSPQLDHNVLPPFSSMPIRDPARDLGQVQNPDAPPTTDPVQASLAILLGNDLPPKPHPVASFFHCLTCAECGISVHLGCHSETGGSAVLDTDVLTGKITSISNPPHCDIQLIVLHRITCHCISSHINNA